MNSLKDTIGYVFKSLIIILITCNIQLVFLIFVNLKTKN
jgi:hypothetical protein